MDSTPYNTSEAQEEYENIDVYESDGDVKRKPNQYGFPAEVLHITVKSVSSSMGTRLTAVL